MEWTAEQRAVIEASGSSLLVSAGAGAGKTAVLVERVLRRLTAGSRPAGVDRLLIVTFTEAAARELRVRIRETLADLAAARPSLRRQAAMVDQAWISTLHAMCLRLLRKYFYLTDLDPAFRVAGEEEAVALRRETLAALLEDRYRDGASDFLDLAESFAGPRGDEPLRRAVLELHAFAVSQSDPEDWLERAAGAFRLPGDLPLDQLPWATAAGRILRINLDRAAGLLEGAAGLAARPGGPGAWRETLLGGAADARRLAAALGRGWTAAAALTAGLHPDRMPPHRGEVDAAIKDRVSTMRREAHTLLEEAKVCLERPPGDLLAELRGLALRMALLVGLVMELDRAYARAKASRLMLDYSDLERHCLNLLEGGAGVSARLRERFEEVFVDEFQDINPLQERLIEHLSRSGDDPSPNLFLVGDVKQSIYRFRMAEPALFLARYHDYPRRPGCRRLHLSANFRSRPAIIHAVNFLFRQLFTEGVAELVYGPEVELAPSRPPAMEGEEVEVHLVERAGDRDAAGDEGVPEDDEAGGDPEEPGEAIEEEARIIAERIRSLVHADPPGLMVPDPVTGGLRRPEYRDMAVLLRATRGQANQLLDVLRLEGVPAWGELATGYADAAEVKVMLSLLRLIDNPLQDLPLAGVLLSPVGGMNPAELAAISMSSTAGLSEAFFASADSRTREFRSRLDRWRTMARRRPVGDLIAAVYRETGYYDRVGAMPAGAQRQANLKALQDRARAFDRGASRGLVGFLRLLEGIEEAGLDLGEAGALEGDEDAVRVMSVHGAKGLEFPVVFLAGLGRRLHGRAADPHLAYHRRMGLGPAVVDQELGVMYPSLAQQAVMGRLRLEDLAEELRILYVAMTRARERLFLIGTVRDRERSLARWAAAATGHREAPLPDGLLAGVSTALDWLGPALARHPDLGLLPAEDCLPRPEPSRFRLVSPPAPPSRDKASLPAGKAAVPATLRPDPALQERFRHAFTWRYPRQALARHAAKRSVSELKGRGWEGEEEPSVAATAAVGGGVEAGTATHLVLRHLDLAAPLDGPGIRRQMGDMLRRELIARPQVGLVDVEAIARFFAGPLGRRVLRDPAHARREVPFTLALPAAEVYPDMPREQAAGERVLVQGVIDLILEEPDGLLILDFKTDRVVAGTEAAAAGSHSFQVRMYARAAAALLGRPVTGTFLHFLAANLTVEVPPA
ncbi:MAG TPA: helicase-exonuclease AddAB subunit AddA [Bacillota bacterium]|nr:helicase-exonuclease AddAB subunit AddA [Bacillota bacterium]